MTKIIIVQTSSAGASFAKEVVDELQIADVFFLNYFDRDVISRLIVPDEKQLLIIGTDRGNPVPVVDMVSHFRETFPKLTCISFAITNMPIPPFHGAIDKLATCSPRHSLKKIIQNFLK